MRQSPPMLDGRIESFIAAAPESADDGLFEELALALFARRYREESAFKARVDALGATRGELTDWRSIPFDEPEAQVTSPARLSARVATLAGALGGLHRPPILAAADGTRDLLDSCGGEGSRAVDRLALGEARSWLAARQRDGRAAAVLASSDAADQLLSGLERQDLRFRLAPGSRLIVSGPPPAADSISDLPGRALDRLGLVGSALVREVRWAPGTTPIFVPISTPETAATEVLPHWMRLHSPSEGVLAVLDLAVSSGAFHLRATPQAGLPAAGVGPIDS